MSVEYSLPAASASYSDIPLELHLLDCEPFFHVYGMNCSDAKIVFALWKLTLVNINGTRFYIPFYVVQGDGLLLIGNAAMYKSDLLNSKEVLFIPPNAGNLATVQLTLPIYNVDIDGIVRTFLMGFPSEKKSFSGCFSLVNRFIHLSLLLMRPIQRRAILQVVCQHFSLIYAFFLARHDSNMSGSKTFRRLL